MPKMTPEERDAFVKDLARDNRLNKENPNDVLPSWDRDNFFGGKSVQLRIPLGDPVTARRHIDLVYQAMHDLRVHMDQLKVTDRSALLYVHGAFRTLNQRLNSYKNPRR